MNIFNYKILRYLMHFLPNLTTFDVNYPINPSFQNHGHGFEKQNTHRYKTNTFFVLLIRKFTVHNITTENILL